MSQNMQLIKKNKKSSTIDPSEISALTLQLKTVSYNVSRSFST